MVKVDDPGGGGVRLTTQLVAVVTPCSTVVHPTPPAHSLFDCGVTPVGQKNACAGNELFGAFQSPVPWMVTNVFPVIEPAVVPTSPVTVGAVGAYVNVGTNDDAGAV
jgi:hypothetical protein